MKYHMEEIGVRKKRQREIESLAWKLMENKGRALIFFTCLWQPNSICY